MRFAPSPNGYLHLGHAFSALFAAGVARAIGARFILRIEDIDRERSRPAFVAQIFDDLAWLGLQWEEPARFQSRHNADYARALDQLDAMGLLYRSWATRRDIARIVARHEQDDGSWPRDPDGVPLFPKAAGATVGQGPAARRLDMERALALAPADLAFTEIGPERAYHRIAAKPAKWGDALLARKDIGTSYHLSVVVDDAIQGVTHVTRGMDLYEATHLHRLLQALLGLPEPVWCHHPLIRDAEGNKLAKSAGAPSLVSLREAGATPEEVRRAVGIDAWGGYFDRLADGMVAERFSRERKS